MYVNDQKSFNFSLTALLRRREMGSEIRARQGCHKRGINLVETPDIMQWSPCMDADQSELILRCKIKTNEENNLRKRKCCKTNNYIIHGQRQVKRGLCIDNKWNMNEPRQTHYHTTVTIQHY